MNHELAKTLTTALVQFIDRERSEGTMCCSSFECEAIEHAFMADNFFYVEALVQRKLTGLTEFENAFVRFLSMSQGEPPMGIEDFAKEHSKELLALAKKELLSYADESNPAIEAMADLERAVSCGNVNNIPKWLIEELDKAFKKGQELSHEDYIRGYTNGYKDANESVAYHFPTMPTTPVFGCDGIHCTNPLMDCLNCPKRTTGGTFTSPNTASGTSTGTLHGNTSATDGKEHNPSFTD